MSDFMSPENWRRLKKDSLTEKQIRNLKHVHENAEALADPDGDWQHDLAAVVESGSMMAWQLEQAFPFLAEGDKDELNE